MRELRRARQYIQSIHIQCRKKGKTFYFRYNGSPVSTFVKWATELDCLCNVASRYLSMPPLRNLKCEWISVIVVFFTHCTRFEFVWQEKMSSFHYKSTCVCGSLVSCGWQTTEERWSLNQISLKGFLATLTLQYDQYVNSSFWCLHLTKKRRINTRKIFF